MKKYVFAFLCLLLLATVAAAQLRVDVRLVNVVATVTDEGGRYVEGLKASDFKLEEDGVEQEIAHFSFSQDQPVSVGILLDSSNSMERKIGTATRAVDRFLRDVHVDDDIFLMTFDGSVRIRQDFTSDRDKLWSALQKVKLGAGTSLYDAVIQGTDKLKKGKYPKKAILLITDGVDTSSEHDYNVARLAVRESEFLVYAMGIAPDGSRVPMSERNPIPGGPSAPGRSPIPIPGAGGSRFPIPLPGPGRRQFPGGSQGSLDSVDMNVLETFATESGGKAWLITPDSRRNKLQDALEEIADELRSQYSLGYYPKHDLQDGKWHHIELKLKNPNYTIRYKSDYVGK
jgi:Ca-activated chloride channel family protein